MWWKILLGIILILGLALAWALSRVDITLGIILHSVLGAGGGTPDDNTLQSRLAAPPGFSVGLYAADIQNARFIEFSEKGDLLVSQPRESRVSIVRRDANGDGIGDGTRVLIDNLNRPHGIDFHNGYLYIAESNAVGRVPFNHETGELTQATMSTSLRD
jgi:glucose/arabinose dehydrogenase